MEETTVEVTIQTLEEVRQTAWSSKRLAQHAARKQGHDPDSCACGICKTTRLLAQMVQEIAALDRPLREQDWH